MYINNLGHMTRMAARPIYGKKISKIFFSGTSGPISTKLGLKHRWLKYYNVYINHDPVMTDPVYGKVNMGCQCIGMGITVKMSFEEKSQQEIGKLTNIDYSEKENGPRASSAPALGLNTIIFKHVFWYMQQISGERLQDHWSSGFISRWFK